jgi:hypothetical protein
LPRFPGLEVLGVAHFISALDSGHVPMVTSLGDYSQTRPSCSDVIRRNLSGGCRSSM